MAEKYLLQARGLKKHFVHRHRMVKALDDVDMVIPCGETVALVGESGCGKTTLAKSILGLYRLTGGEITLNGVDIGDARRVRKFISQNVQIVFQNPYLSVDPRYTVFGTLYEALTVFEPVPRKQAHRRCVEVLGSVDVPESTLWRYPHQLSGGQLQRVCIARSILQQPKLIILDEPTSSLDIATTLKILDLLKKLQRERNLSFLFISHNLKLVRYISDYVWVMYYGKIVEWGRRDDVYQHPAHPYTRLLLAAAYQRLDKVKEHVPAESGCIFQSRCGIADEACLSQPPLVEVSPGHFARCHHTGEVESRE